MRTRDLNVSALSPAQLSIRFQYPEKLATQGTVRDLIAKLESDPEFRTLQSARAPHLFYPNRWVLFGVWFAGTLLAGFLMAAALRRLRA